MFIIANNFLTNTYFFYRKLLQKIPENLFSNLLYILQLCISFRISSFFTQKHKHYFSRFEGSTSYVIFNGSEYCLYSLLVLYYNRVRLYTSDTSCLDTSYLLPRTGNGTTSKSSRRVFKHNILTHFSFLSCHKILLVIIFF